MSVDQNHGHFLNQPLQATAIATPVKNSWRTSLRALGLRRRILIALSLLFTMVAAGPQNFTPLEQQQRAIARSVRGLDFDLLSWEYAALRDKVNAYFAQPAATLTAEEGSRLVQEYLQRAQQIGAIEGELARLAAEAPPNSSDGSTHSTETEALQAQLDALRAQQQADRPAVEQVIQKQVGDELVAAGFGFAGRPLPPVLFTFTEPPKKMVVSPRDRIETIYGHMLDAQIDLETIEEREAAIAQEQDVRAYITSIGGLGAFPTMVVDRAGLGWVLSTVAHEWTHNYLSLLPLGLNYTKSSDLIIMNESVAEVVGNEIGERVLQKYYPELMAEEAERVELDLIPIEQGPTFQFRREMRKTRQEVDRLLADGKIEEAEAYMEKRRLEFVEHGYPLRVLNQAYFAFHGSYVTSPSSSSPIGPKIEELRARLPDLHSFLQTVRSFTSVTDLDNALARLSGDR